MASARLEASGRRAAHGIRRSSPTRRATLRGRVARRLPGSFVSAEGLVVTNHHCVQGALQLNSKEGKNYVEDGFLAKTKADEPTAGPAQKVMVAQKYTDVTTQMRDGLDEDQGPIARKLESEKRQKELVAACEKDRPGIRCQVSSFFHGGQYQLIEMLEIRDVRLVYAPARSVGDYGGEIDNWEWPRHTGDWSFFRAYVGKDGKPADYSPDNVPYQPKHWLQVSTAGLKPGDFGDGRRLPRTDLVAQDRDEVERPSTGTTRVAGVRARTTSPRSPRSARTRRSR